MKRRFFILTLCVIATLPLAAWSQSKPATFQFLNVPPGTPWANFALSADGKVLAANLGGEIYRWTADQGFVDLGAGDPLNESVGISADGSTITATIVGPDGLTNPGRWREATGWINLGHLTQGCQMDGNWGSGYSLNSDGSVLVGLAWYCPGAQGFRWSEKNGMKGLSHPAHGSSRASAISADGKTVVGFYEHSRQGFRRAVRWVGGRKDLFTGDMTPGEATAVTSNGAQIVGQAVDASGSPHAFYYSDTTGLISLGTVSGSPSDESVANGISEKGLVIGWSGDPFFGGVQAFVWNLKNPTRPMHPLQQKLQNAGAVIPAGTYLINALSISADGSTIVGTWQDVNFNQGSWIAHLP